MHSKWNPLVLPTAPAANSTNQPATTEFVTSAIAAALLKGKVIHFQRDLTATSGSVAYTGAGFTPTCLIAIAFVNATATFSVGIVGSDKGGASVDYYGNNLVTSLGSFLQIQLADASAGKYQSADVSSFDSDGFTLSWTKTGLPTGTADIYVLCLR